MKKHSLLSVLLAVVLVFSCFCPVAYAAEPAADTSGQLSKVITYENYSIRGVENSKVRFNILIDNDDKTGQFALVYQNSPDYVYEFVFDLADVPRKSSTSSDLWDDIRAYCFDNESLWTETNIKTAVTIIHEAEENTLDHDVVRMRSAETDYFENWLINKYGNEYSGSLVTTKTQNGIKMYLKKAFQVYAYKSTTYMLNQTMTVVGFVTAILGFSASNPIVSVLGVIAGTSGLFSLNQSVYKYTLRANWFKYCTCVSGTGYPYGLTNKFTFYDGYSYSKTGTCNVDTASASTSYVPSSTVYNSNTKIFDAAFDEYQRIGYQPGNF